MELKSRNVAIIIFIMHQNLKSALFTLCRIIYSNIMDWSFPPKYTCIQDRLSQTKRSTTGTEYD